MKIVYLKDKRTLDIILYALLEYDIQNYELE